MRIDYDTLATEYARHRQVHPGILQSLISTGRLAETSRVLDVGCGTGNYVAALEQATGCQCWGCEPSEQMLAQAKAKNPTARLVLGQAERLGYAAESFDMVFSVDVIHHVSDRAEYLRQAHRVLKPGGRVCTVTDSDDIIRHRQPLSVYFPETVEIEMQRYPRIADLRDMMARAGFSQIQDNTVEFAYTRSDIQIYRDKAFSCLLLISPEAFGRGIQRMEQDLRAGPIQCVSRYLMLWGVKGL